MRINHNISAMITQYSLGRANNGLSMSLERLSTGLRINKASDDAAGLSVSEQLRTQIRGSNQAKHNGEDAIALLKIADGAMNEVHSILQRQRELAVQSSSDTLTNNERSFLDQEFQALSEELTRINEVTQYNTIKILQGGAENAEELTARLNDDWIPDAIATVTTAYNNLTAFGNIQVTGEEMDGSLGRLATGGTDGTQATINLDLADFDSPVTDIANPNGDMPQTGNVLSAQEILIHEMTHALQYINGHQPPTWFSEGAAEASNQGGADRVTSLLGTYGSIDAIINASSFASIGGTIDSSAWSGSDEDYATAYLAAKYLQDNSGGGINGVYSSQITGQAQFEANLAAAYGSSYNNFMTAFLTSGAAANSGPVIAEQDGSTITGEGFSGVTWEIGEDLVMHIGANALADVDTLAMEGLGAVSAGALGIDTVSIASGNAARSSIDTVSNAINTVSERRSSVGALINRLEHAVKNLDNQIQNTQSAESQIRDVDFSTETMNFTRQQIMVQTSTSMLAQANLSPKSILSLIS
ncbi:MAG: hypothetical protein JNL74_00885 [Fibrobacteres bacterium]|nr:hypothetical protein [Fibrobacterota bacterium]